MANPFTKAWKYLMALFSSKVDEYADPKVQIQQAIEDAQRQHAALSQQAAAVIGNQRQLEMKLTRQMGDVERLSSSARQALVLADEQRAKGNAAEADKYEQTAQAFATQLVAAEQQMEDLKAMHDQALQAAQQAKKAVENNAMQLQTKLAERTKLLSQLEQAKMQEQVSASLQSMSQLQAPGNVPSLDEVRDKIERRYANALGSAELHTDSVEGRMLEVQKSTLDMAGASRLDQLRAQLHPELAAQQPRSIDAATGTAAPSTRRRAAAAEQADLIRKSRDKRKAAARGVDTPTPRWRKGSSWPRWSAPRRRRPCAPAGIRPSVRPKAAARGAAPGPGLDRPATVVAGARRRARPSSSRAASRSGRRGGRDGASARAVDLVHRRVVRARVDLRARNRVVDRAARRRAGAAGRGGRDPARDGQAGRLFGWTAPSGRDDRHRGRRPGCPRAARRDPRCRRRLGGATPPAGDGPDRAAQGPPQRTTRGGETTGRHGKALRTRISTVWPDTATWCRRPATRSLHPGRWPIRRTDRVPGLRPPAGRPGQRERCIRSLNNRSISSGRWPPGCAS